MSGKPAARQGDMTQYGGPIVQGSAGVRIGAPTGVACSVCPGGMTSGNPVNPLLGAKVLPGETDLALPGPLPFILSRTYSSYRTRTPAPEGVFGPGWKAPSDIRLQLRDDALVLNDNGGRSIHFEPLLPGEAVYSRSESMWLVRGGKAAQPDGHTLARLWGALPPDIRLSPHLYLATNSAQGLWWILGWSERVPGAEDVLPAPLPPYRVLTGLADRFGRTLTYRREAAGDLAGEITGVTDGAGREFRLVLTTQAQRAEEARTSSLSSSDSSRPLSASPFPDTLPGTEYGPDRGIRLSAVWLMHDPAYPESLPGAPLARYTYTEAGELLAVYDRSNTQVRAFTYDAQHPGRMVAHRYAGRPEMRYRYDDTGRVVEQLNPAGLSYRYQYEQDRITVTDSLNRREVLHTEGGAGLKRVVKKELADGSVTHSGYDAAGRLTAQTDAAGRRTEYGLNVVSGDITDITTPDGRETKFYYNDGNQLTAVVSPDGLESRREYDEPGRLVSETSRSGETVRYRYDDAHSELPATTTDATGSTRQMTWSRYGQLLAFTDCSGYQTRYEYDRFGQMTAVHREEGISLYRHYDNRGRLTSVKDAQGRETQYEYNAAGDLTAVITPDGNRSETQYDAWGKAVSTTQGGLTRSMEYDAAGRVISLTNENGSHSDFSYDALDRLVQQGGFDGRTQRYHYDLTGKLTQSEDEGLVTLWHYDASDRITHRTVNGDPAEQWQYDGHGWLTDISHLSEGHRVAVHYGYDDKGRLTGERQTVENPETGELLWQHETTHAYNEQGLANRVTPDSLPPVEWLTYGSGYLAGMKLGDTPLLEYTRDRMHRETVRSFGSMAGSNAAYKLTSTYTPAGQLQSQHLNSLVYDRDYGWNDNGDLVRISGPRQTREYGYSATGRLESVRTLAPDLDIRIPYATDPAGNRLPDPELHPDSTLTAWPDNRIAEDAHYVYHYDEYGRLTEKTDRIPEGVIRMHDERTHHYHYDSQHRLVFYTRIQHGEPLVESRYLYDPLGRRMAKRVWRRERDLTGWMSLSRKPEVTWYGWDGDRLTTIQTGTTRIQTVYQPGSFTPLLRIETENGEQAKARHRSLAEVLQEDTGVTLPAELAVMLGRLERELRAGAVSAESEAWLAQCGLTAEQMAAQMEAEYIPERKLHLYHCDHRGLPQALISPEGETAWCGEYDEWGNLLGETSAQHLQQSLRLPGQQYDEESGLYYNRNRYYDPLQGRYITQDPIGLKGGWNLYAYPLNPVQRGDPLGLSGETLVLGSATTVTGTKFGGALLSGGAATFDAVTTAMASAAPALGAMAVVAGPMGYDLLANDGRAGKALSDGQLINSKAEMCYWTSSCPLDSPHENDNSSGSQPNVGKDLTDEEKNCLAGGSAGSPGGWGPEDEEKARSRGRGSDTEAKIKDLDLLHSPETIGSRPDLAKLTDSELLESVINPKSGDRVTVNTKTNKVMDGNSRVYELKKRADDPNSSITGETTIPVETYTPDDSFFWDM
ncbi:RHS element core protein [Escherichia coli]|uniref:RHS element core protein n=4 Tax=Enterobacteriaceae TaxID=543 RepID=UPI0004D62728|nr:RHS element core protein [Escherichia coli]KDW42387.1 RHS repeat-associated core domain protein [Escherichia coli 2-177-06_S4_C2]